MLKIDDRLVYSATDLVGFLECGHLTNLERAAVSGHLDRPMRLDPVLDRIAQRGQQHEARFLESLRSEAVAVVEIGPDEELPFRERVARGRDATLSAMRAGRRTSSIRPCCSTARRLGYADFLRAGRARPATLGPWGYEVWDTKLARYAKASAVLQICMYSDMVAGLQGRLPEEMHLALGGVQAETVSFRVADFAAYCRLVAREFEAIRCSRTRGLSGGDELRSRWGTATCAGGVLRCRAEWRASDDLSLVAGLTPRQRRALATDSGDHDADRARRSPPRPLPERLDGAGRDALEEDPRPSEHPGAGRTHQPR